MSFRSNGVHAIRADQNIYFVFGSTDRFAGIEDFFVLLRDLLDYCLGKPLFLSEVPVPGHWNIYCEGFDPGNRNLLCQAKKKDPATKSICIATEMPAGKTFNYFGSSKLAGPGKLVWWPAKATRDFLNHAGLLAVLKKRPFGEYLLRWYRELKTNASTSRYESFGYWESRYGEFIRTLPYLDHVWYVDPGQEQGYSKIVDPGKLWYMPITPFVDAAPETPRLPSQPDMDFLFTGTETSYRIQMVERFRQMGFSIISGCYSETIRRSFLNRSKVCLHIKPFQGWSAPSPMRLHMVLMAGKCIVSEGLPPSNASAAPQSPFVEWAPSDKFLEAAAKAVENDPVERGLRMRKGYIAATRDLRLKAKRDVERMFLPNGWSRPWVGERPESADAET